MDKTIYVVEAGSPYDSYVYGVCDSYRQMLDMVIEASGVNQQEQEVYVTEAPMNTKVTDYYNYKTLTAAEAHDMLKVLGNDNDNT